MLFLALAVFNLNKSYADEIEQKFKIIGVAIAKETAETVSPVGPEYAVPDKEREETFARQRKLFKEWQGELRSLIVQDPQSIWADDAQYLIAVLDIEDPQKHAEELEQLLIKYPNFHIEDWTKKYIILVSEKASPLFVRFELCSLYKEMGNLEKLDECCKKGANDFPEKAAAFEKISKSVAK
jgi:hypothetical protein